jgi:hypothetical protein
MRDQGPDLSFAPRLPGELTRLAFRITRRHQTLAVDIRPAAVTYTLTGGPPMRITHHGRQVTVPPGGPVTCPVPALAAPPAAAQLPGREPARRAPAQNTRSLPGGQVAPPPPACDPPAAASEEHIRQARKLPAPRPPGSSRGPGS